LPPLFLGDEMATLAEVNAAITKVTDEGQSSTVDGISYTRANLASLTQLRDTLKSASARAAGSRPTFRGFNFSSMGYD